MGYRSPDPSDPPPQLCVPSNPPGVRLPRAGVFYNLGLWETQATVDHTTEWLVGTANSYCMSDHPEVLVTLRSVPDVLTLKKKKPRPIAMGSHTTGCPLFRERPGLEDRLLSANIR